MAKHLFDYLQATIKRDWNEPAITDFEEKKTDSYGDLATYFLKKLALKKAIKLPYAVETAPIGLPAFYPLSATKRWPYLSWMRFMQTAYTTW